MDLKSFREDKLKIKTQAQFAELIGVDQSSVSRWEKDPGSITLETIIKIMNKTGASFEEITGWEKPIPEPLKVEDTWAQVDFTKKTMASYISELLKKISLPDDLRKTYVSDLEAGIIANLIKPKVAIVGRSDTGKSTLINALLGVEKMPVAWTPMTSIAVYLKHVDDKPNYIDEDVWIFADHNDSEEMWDERRLNDEDYCRSWKIAAGGIETLRSYGTRQGDYYEKDAGSAVVFVDAPILKTCDIIDLPGFGTEADKDDNITFSVSQKADIIIYLSQANGFMRIEDITYLKRNINELPIWEKNGENDLTPLSNLFIVASQAHTVDNGNRAQLLEILDVGCKNLLNTLPDKYWEERRKASGYDYVGRGYKELLSRFFAYTTDIKDICDPFNDALSKILELLPAVINERAKSFVKQYVSQKTPMLTAEIEKYEGIVNERDKYDQLLKEIDSNDLKRVKDNDARKKEIRKTIQELRTESTKEFTEYVSKTVNVDSIVSLMSEKGVKNKKESIEHFGSYFTSIIQEKCQSILNEKSDRLKEMTEKYISDYSGDVSYPFSNYGINVDFNAGWTFASALSNLGLIGGFGAYLVSSIYGTLTLTSAGATFGSAIATGFFAGSILGPIGITIGLVIAVSIALKIFTGGWQKNTAKQIISKFENEGVAEKYRKGIEDYWKQTSDAFDVAAKALDEEWNQYVADLRETLSSYDINEIEARIAHLRNIKSFFENIPL